MANISKDEEIKGFIKSLDDYINFISNFGNDQCECGWFLIKDCQNHDCLHGYLNSLAKSGEILKIIK